MSWKHRLRTTAAKTLQSVLPYTSYALTEQEYLGTYDGSLADVRAELRDRGYHYQLFAATKQHPDRDQTDDGSFARIPDGSEAAVGNGSSAGGTDIPDRHPSEADGTGLDGLDPRECQYHVQLFADGETVELYGHYEIHPYPWTPTWDITRPYPRHYYPTWDYADHGSANPYASPTSRDDPNRDRSEWTYLRGVCDSRIEPLLVDN